MAAAAEDRHLTVSLDSAGAAKPLHPYGESIQFDNELFVGTAFFAHTPPADSEILFAHQSMLDGRSDGKGGPTPLWELQVQGRFKVAPSGPMFIGFELWDGPMPLGKVTQAFCSIILKFAASLAKQRNIDIRHSFGDSEGERPKIAFPLTGSDRIFLSDEPVPLPIIGGSGKGVWRQSDGKWVKADKSDVKFGPELGYVTLLFATARLDWTSWTVERVPGVGSLDLKRFWGDQAAHVVIFDEVAESRRIFFELCLAQRQGGPSPLAVHRNSRIGGTKLARRRRQVITRRQIFEQSLDLRPGQRVDWDFELLPGSADAHLGESDVIFSVSALWCTPADLAEQRRLCDCLKTGSGFEVLRKARRICAADGRVRDGHAASKQGIVWLRWSNAHSMIRGKTLRFRISVSEQVDDETTKSQKNQSIKSAEPAAERWGPLKSRNSRARLAGLMCSLPCNPLCIPCPQGKGGTLLFGGASSLVCKVIEFLSAKSR